jgi:diadenosine tetraphosphate (Ap4A) HIT family hydrolase
VVRTARSEAIGCVFCTRDDQPETLFETPHLYAMPDKFPLRPGHTLIISKAHTSCYAAPPELLPELDAAAARVRRFLAEAYGEPVLTFENGIAGQTVFHAHLHLVPARVEALPAEIAAHEDLAPVEGWGRVREHFARRGHYRYVELGGARYVIDGFSPVLWTMRKLMAEATGLAWDEHGWRKTTTPDDVQVLAERWRGWDRHGRGLAPRR